MLKLQFKKQYIWSIDHQLMQKSETKFGYLYYIWDLYATQRSYK